MRPVWISIRTGNGEFKKTIKEPTRALVVKAIEELYTDNQELGYVDSLWVEMPYSEGTFRYEVEDPSLSPDENGSWIWDALENFRY